MALQKLANETVQLISSSQVITSVHSVVKELVENSLDAKSSNIEIKLENYGLELIQVRDNGTGIKKSDVPLMAAPHYTSKLSSYQDISSLKSYGFRGEALSSIAVVAELSITTATKEDEIACTYFFNHCSEVVSTKPSSLSSGTTVTVQNLFNNVPVRKKCYKSLKRCRDDLKKVELVLLAFGLAHPSCRFSLKHNKMIVWEKERTSDIKANLALVLGPGVTQNMMPVNYQCFNPMIKLQVHVPKPSADLSVVSRARPDRMFLLVNQRPVEIKQISKLVRDAFVEAFPSQSGRYPVAVVNISVLPEELDVNLEPNKTSVLLHNIDLITSTLSSLLTQAYGPCKVSDKSAKKTQRQKQTIDPSPVQSTRPPPSTESPGHPASVIETGDPTVEDRVVVLPRRQLTQSNAETIKTQTDDTPTSSVGKDLAASVRAPKEVDIPEAISIEHSVAGEARDGVQCENDLQAVEDYSLLDISELEKGFSSGEEETAVEESDSPRENNVDNVCNRATAVVSSNDMQPITKKVSLLSWSRGEAITDAAQRPVEPVKVICPSAVPSTVSDLPITQKPSQSKLTFKRQSQVFDLIDSRPVKRRFEELSTSSEEETANKRVKQQPPANLSLDRFIQGKHYSLGQSEVAVEEHELPCLSVEVDLNGIARRNESLAQSVSPMRLVDHVVGSCQSLLGDDLWIVLLNDKLAGFNIRRALGTSMNRLLVLSKTEVEKVFMDILKNDSFHQGLNPHFNEIHSLE